MAETALEMQASMSVDTEAPLEHQWLLGGQQPRPAPAGGRTKLAVVAAAVLTCAAAAALLQASAASSRHGGRVAQVETLLQDHLQDFSQLAEQPAACAAYADCAVLEGNCCPADDGSMLGCCNSPRVPSNRSAGKCMDTAGWTNGYTKCGLKGFTPEQGCTLAGVTCEGYELLKLCADGAVVPGKEWAAGEKLNSPELNCCACGKEPSPGAFPINGSQGEPSTADCSRYSACADLGINGHCCPTDEGLMLGCCADLGADDAAPALLPPAREPGKLMTFYMYRVANDEDYPINGVNMANLAGDMWYLHNEVVQHCPRKFNMERLLRFRVTVRATRELLGQGRNFDAFVAFDQAKCTVPMCPKLHWDPYGYVVGCQPNNIGQVAVPGSPVWYSLPGTCPSKFYYEKTTACNQAEPGGACPTATVTGSRNCTYYLERAGEIRLDELSGLTNYNTDCVWTGQREYDIFTDMGVGTKFWNGKTDAEAGARRIQKIEELFAKRYPDMPRSLDDPVCDVVG